VENIQMLEENRGIEPKHGKKYYNSPTSVLFGEVDSAAAEN